MIRTFSLPCDIGVDVLFDNEKLYILGYAYLSDSLNFVIGLFDIKDSKVLNIVRFSSEALIPWYYNDLTLDSVGNIRIESSDLIHYYTSNLTFIRKEVNQKSDSDYSRSPKLNFFHLGTRPY